MCRDAADKGYADAQFVLGILYRRGQGVPKDDGQAFPWLRKAALQGRSDAQATVALMYSTGGGVPKDEGEALGWYRKAAAQGDWRALVQLSLSASIAKMKGEVVADDAVGLSNFRFPDLDRV